MYIVQRNLISCTAIHLLKKLNPKVKAKFFFMINVEGSD